MEDSFFEYRAKTGVSSDSDSEIIDNSLVETVPFSAKKKNNTVFVAESEESTEDESEADQTKHNLSKAIARRSSFANAHVESSSDEEASRKGSNKKQSVSDDKLVLSSTDEDELVSPELIPKRQPQIRQKSMDSNDSVMIRRTKKRILMLDSGTDNSIVIEQDRHNKLTCLKDTPLKLEGKANNMNKRAEKSMDYDEVDEYGSEDEDNESESEDNQSESENNSSKNEHNDSESDYDDAESVNDPENNKANNESIFGRKKKLHVLNDSLDSAKATKSSSREVSHDHDYYTNNSDNSKDNEDNDVKNDDNGDESDDGPDEDLMVMSRATRMSIMGVIPKGDESDDSDFIQSDESSRKSTNSISDLPEVSIAVPKTPEKPSEDGNTSTLSCSPFASPLHDITNKLNKSTISDKEVIDLSNVDYIPLNDKVPNQLANKSVNDDDVAIIEIKSEIIALSSDDDDESKKHEDEENIEPEESASATEAIRAVLSPNNPVFKLEKPSSKIQAVMDYLEKNVFANKGDKAVVVSQWTSVLRLVESELESRRVRSVTLSGNVPVPARPALINAVNDPNSDIKVMLLSLCAGGVGINLCGANHLLLLDPHWNPQLEEQAQDRIYRVGQKKDVHVYRFMCVDTVEQTIRKLQEAKLALAENVLTGPRNTAASALSIEDLKMLFNMGETG